MVFGFGITVVIHNDVSSNEFLFSHSSENHFIEAFEEKPKKNLIISPLKNNPTLVSREELISKSN